MAKKHGKSPQQRAAETRKQRREQDALRNAYDQKFGIPMVFEWSAKNIKLLKRTLAIGKDQPELIAMRKECERNVRAYDKRRAKEETAKLAYVFTAKDEKEYNHGLSRFRVRVEHKIAQIKRFRMLSDRFRYPRPTHAAKFAIVAGIVNILAGF